MTVQCDFNASEHTAENALSLNQVRIPDIDPKRIRYLALNGGDEAARAYAATTAGRTNAGIRARLERQLKEGEADVAAIEQQIADYSTQADGRSSILWRRKPGSEPWARMSKWEVVHAVFYIFLTILALGVATYALALMLSELGAIEKLSDDIFRAVLYAFPVVLASSGFASMATLHDDEKVIERRTMRLLQWGAFFFFSWIILAGIVFVGEPGGFNVEDVLSLENNPLDEPSTTVGPADSMYAFLSAFFPIATTNSMLLIVHIVAEVLIAAGLTSRVVLMGRKTRDIVAYHCPRAEKARARVAELVTKKQFRTVVIANVEGQLAEIEAVKEQYIEDVALLAAGEARIAEALRAAAQAKSDQDYLESAQ